MPALITRTSNLPPNIFLVKANRSWTEDSEVLSQVKVCISTVGKRELSLEAAVARVADDRAEIMMEEAPAIA